ncbi:MAG TPA: ATP-binding cassette domain-containing protein, partial [Hyphomicrobiaceae bacterium]|nr:ATP-binding cassette domain-containing protein [Hyphomicrobiaceae bacterium]
SMGLLPGYLGRWRSDRDLALVDHQRGTEWTASLQSLAKAGRVALQSLMLGLGAWLVVEQAAGAGVMFAASLLLGRALQPVEQIAAAYRGIQGARAAWSSLDALLQSCPPQVQPIRRTSFQPTGLTAEGVSVMLPTAQRPILYNINFQVMPGEIVAIVGPTGAGKSLLAGVIAGAVNPTMGTVRLHGMPMSGVSCHGLGPRIGYLADEPALLPGTIVANISRFRNAAPAEIVAAASMAGAHEMILRLPMGYETVLSEGAGQVTAGLRQRIALARAFFGSPGLLVLDGPEARLDSLAEAALPRALLALKTRRVCTVVVSHRPSILAIADRIALMRGGTIAVQGPPDAVLRIPRPAPVKSEKRA